MARRQTVAVILALFAACSGVGDRPEEIVFRVGATAGLGPLVAGRELEGSSAAAADLVFEYLDQHIEEIRPDGARLRLERRSTSPYTAEQLAASFRSPGLVSASATGPGEIEAIFKDEASARLGADPANHAAFDLGPYRVESQQLGHARLRRRGPGAIDVIEIVQVSSADEWRKLMARELDVMSFSPDLYREQFTGMSSVRLLDIPAVIDATLYFNVRDPALASAAVRRRIAAGLNRPAVARVAGGDPASATAAPVGGPEEAVALPERLSLLVGQDDSTMLLAASVLRHQLDRLNIAVQIEPVPLDDLTSQVGAGRHQLVLGPLPSGPRRFGRFLSPDAGRPSMTGFADPAFDAAVAAADLDRAQAILDREMPATPLYQLRGFAAIDARFCGKVEPSVTSWRWMADLRPCEDGYGEGKDTP